MDLQSFLSFISAFGLGGFATMLIKYFLDRKANAKDALFSARLKAYSSLSSRLFNIFYSDVKDLKGFDRNLKIKELISESILISDGKLTKLLLEFTHIIVDFYKEIESKDTNKLKILSGKTTNLASKILTEMRNELK